MGYRIKPFTMSVRNNSTQEFVDVGLLGSDVEADITELNQKTDWFVTPQMFGAVGDGVTDDTTSIQSALNSSKNVFFPEGEYLVTSTLFLNQQFNLDGTGHNKSVIKINTDIPLFKISNDIDDPFSFNGSTFSNFGCESTGSSYGTDSNGYGILFGDPSSSSTLMNIPRVQINNCRFRGFKVGAYIEGYGHTFRDVYFTHCNTGFELVHPEQVLIENTWVAYCNIGVKVNNSKKKFGHNIQIIGGAIQRNNYGAKIFNCDEPTINTYCELNNYSDFEFGDSADPTNYTSGCRNVSLRYFTSGEDANNTSTRTYCVGIYATVGADIDIFNYSSYAGNNTPNVYVDGYSKYIRINGHSEVMGQTSTPYNIVGSARQSTYINLDGNQQYSPTSNSATYKVQYSNGVDTPFAVDGIEYKNGVSRKKTEYTNSGKNVYLSKESKSELNVYDSSDGSTLFAILNNPSATYRIIRAGIPIGFLDSSDNNYKQVRVYNNELQMYYNNAWNNVMMVKENSDSSYHPLRLNNGVLQYYTNGSWQNVKATSV